MLRSGEQGGQEICACHTTFKSVIHVSPIRAQRKLTSMPQANPSDGKCIKRCYNQLEETSNVEKRKKLDGREPLSKPLTLFARRSDAVLRSQLQMQV